MTNLICAYVKTTTRASNVLATIKVLINALVATPAVDVFKDIDNERTISFACVLPAVQDEPVSSIQRSLHLPSINCFLAI